MDNKPQETRWALLDDYGQEMVLRRRGSIKNVGLSTTILRVPAGSYRFYMNDVDGICCKNGRGGIVIYLGDSNQELFRHDGVFFEDILLNVTIPSPDPAMAPIDAEPATTNTLPGMTIPAKPALPSEIGSPTDASGMEVIKSTLRVEIFYDMYPMETGWFLVNTDSNEEIYASTYDKNRTIPANHDKAMTLVVEEFEELNDGNYWFVIADAAQNGICCSSGDGYARIVQVTLFESSLVAETTQVQKRDDSGIILEEKVLWESNGTFGAFAEAHFGI